MSGTDPPSLEVTLSCKRGEVWVVSARGGVDLSTAQELDAAICEAVPETGKGGRVVLDLMGIGFMDVTGLNFLIRVREAVREAHGHLALVCSEQVKYLLGITGLDDNFDLYPNLDSAVRGETGS